MVFPVWQVQVPHKDKGNWSRDLLVSERIIFDVIILLVWFIVDSHSDIPFLFLSLILSHSLSTTSSPAPYSPAPPLHKVLLPKIIHETLNMDCDKKRTIAISAQVCEGFSHERKIYHGFELIFSMYFWYIKSILQLTILFN